MVHKPLAARVALVAGFRRALPVFREMIIAAVAVGMWESRRDFQGVWEGWKAGFMAFQAFHTPALCALHVRQFEGASPLSNLMEVKD